MTRILRNLWAFQPHPGKNATVPDKEFGTEGREGKRLEEKMTNPREVRNRVCGIAFVVE